ncbi:MAG: 50S ribosomal protein L17 [Rickettsia sp.]|nr:50S ribosomal protein L17 [Rickettsia sp.]
MRHRLRNDKLNRTSSHRDAMLSNMSVSLINHERIKTTLPKAKMLRPYFEKLVTKAKTSSLVTIRYLLSKIKNRTAVFKLVYELAVRSKDRKGGYVRIVKSYNRYGDNAPIAYIAFVDQNNKNSKSLKVISEPLKSDFKKSQTDNQS